MSPNPLISRRSMLTGTAAAALASAGSAVWPGGRARAGQAPTTDAPPTISVFASMSNGAIVRLLPAGSQLIGHAPGLAVRPEGDVYIANRDAFLAALPFTLHTTDGTTFLVLDEADYLDQEQLRANCVTWFDAADQRTVLLTADDTEVEEWDCRAVSARRARNDVYADSRPTFVTTSAAGADHPALRWDAPSSGAIYGLFFEAAPVFYGLKSLAIETPTSLQLQMDDDYNTNTQLQPSITFPTASTPAPVVDSLNVFVGLWRTDGSFVGRLNGQQVASESGFAGRFDYDGFGAVVFYAAPTSDSLPPAELIMSGSSLGNAYTWTGDVFTGDLFEWWSLIDVDPGLAATMPTSARRGARADR